VARPGLLQHRKFVRLARLLGSDALALGHLEIIWQAAYQSGDPGLGTVADLEYMARWNGDAGALANALLLAGFIDAIPGTDELSVHDLMDHAPDYVRRRMERENERTGKGKKLHEIRAKAGRKGGRSKAGQRPVTDKQMTVSDRSVTDVCLSPGVANGATPSPSPSPSPKEENTLRAAPATRAQNRPRDELFDAIAEISGVDPKVSGSHIGKVRSALLKADPPYTPAEVRLVPAAIARHGLGVAVTLGVIEKYIGWTRRAPAGSPAEDPDDAALRQLHAENGIFP
jgi:hypothetical protein